MVLEVWGMCAANDPWFGFRESVVKRRVLSDSGWCIKTIKKDYLGVDKGVCCSIGKGYRRLVVHPSDEVSSLLRRRSFTVVTTFFHR